MLQLMVIPIIMEALKNNRVFFIVFFCAFFFLISEERSFGQCMISLDLSVHSRISLRDTESTISTLGDIAGSLNKEEPFPSYRLGHNNQVLEMLFFPGDVNNSVSRFIIRYKKQEELLNENVEWSFISSNGIYLGMSIDEIVSSKCNCKEDVQMRVLEDRDICIIRFEFDGSSSRLKHYNMPLYSQVYTFYKSRLIEYEFGFEYP